jgi:hypothetical protein
MHHTGPKGQYSGLEACAVPMLYCLVFCSSRNNLVCKCMPDHSEGLLEQEQWVRLAKGPTCTQTTSLQPNGVTMYHMGVMLSSGQSVKCVTDNHLHSSTQQAASCPSLCSRLFSGNRHAVETVPQGTPAGRQSRRHGSRLQPHRRPCSAHSRRARGVARRPAGW